MKPCPTLSCKNRHPVTVKTYSGYHVVFQGICRECGMRGPKAIDEESAVELWNESFIRE